MQQDTVTRRLAGSTAKGLAGRAVGLAAVLLMGRTVSLTVDILGRAVCLGAVRLVGRTFGLALDIACGTVGLERVQVDVAGRATGLAVGLVG